MDTYFKTYGIGHLRVVFFPYVTFNLKMMWDKGPNLGGPRKTEVV